MPDRATTDMVPGDDPRSKRARRQYISATRGDQFRSFNGLLSCSRYQHSGDGLRIQRAHDAAEQVVVTEAAVYVFVRGKSTLIHRWGHGPGLYIPF